MQRCITLVVLGIKIGLVGQQQFDHVPLVSARCHVIGSPGSVSCTHCRQMQRCDAATILGIDLFIGKQQFLEFDEPHLSLGENYCQPRFNRDGYATSDPNIPILAKCV